MTQPAPLVLACLAAAVAAASAFAPNALSRLADVGGRLRQLRDWASGRPDALRQEVRLLVATAAGAFALLLAPSAALALPCGLGASLGAFLAAGLIPDPRRRRLGAQIGRDVPEALDLLAACLDAGLPLRRAVDHVSAAVAGPLGEELSKVAAQVAVGVPEVDAWRALAGHRQLAHLAREAERGLDTGVAMGEGMRRLADEARRDWRSNCQSRARSVGVRTVLPLALCYLPAFFLVGVVPVLVGAFTAIA